MLLLAALAVAGSHHGLKSIDYWLNRYQTLVTGMIALIAAGIGFQAVRGQIDANLELDEQRRKRDQAAARAMLTVALSDICDHARQCASLLSKWRHKEKGAFALPGLDNSNIQNALPRNIGSWDVSL